MGEPQESPLEEEKPNPDKEAEDAYGIKDDGKYHTADPEYLVNQEIRRDVFTSQEEAEDRAEEIGCEGFHTHNEDGQVIYMPCRTQRRVFTIDRRRVKTNRPKTHTRYG